jgi:hypothetical protein
LFKALGKNSTSFDFSPSFPPPTYNYQDLAHTEAVFPLAKVWAITLATATLESLALAILGGVTLKK